MPGKNKRPVENKKLTEFLLYKSPGGEIKVDVLLRNETIWLPQKQMAELFDVNVPAISKHLNNIFEEGELEKAATVSILEIVQDESGRKVKRNVEFYNLTQFGNTLIRESPFRESSGNRFSQAITLYSSASDWKSLPKILKIKKTEKCFIFLSFIFLSLRFLPGRI